MGPQDIISIANVDLNFGNIFVDQHNNFEVIDYEWVFEFDTPKEFIIYRALQAFNDYHQIDLRRHFKTLKDVGTNESFVQMEECFIDYVCSKSRLYCLNNKIMKAN